MFKLRLTLFVTALTLLMPGMALSTAKIMPSEKSAKVNKDFSGTWTVRWLSNDSRNPIKLTQSGANFSGQYINDGKDSCTVSGDLDEANHFIKLHVKCPKWDIQMEGFHTLDTNTIVGEYLAYGKAVGGFIMSRGGVASGSGPSK